MSSPWLYERDRPDPWRYFDPLADPLDEWPTAAIPVVQTDEQRREHTPPLELERDDLAADRADGPDGDELDGDRYRWGTPGWFDGGSSDAGPATRELDTDSIAAVAADTYRYVARVRAELEQFLRDMLARIDAL